MPDRTIIDLDATREADAREWDDEANPNATAPVYAHRHYLLTLLAERATAREIIAAAREWWLDHACYRPTTSSRIAGRTSMPDDAALDALCQMVRRLESAV